MTLLEKLREVGQRAHTRVSDLLHGVTKARSPHWPSVRRAFLQQFPTCAACGSVEHLNVHHVEPFHVAPALELEPKNLITLCEGPEKCHLRIGHDGDWRLWNPCVRAQAARLLKAKLFARRK